MEPTEIQEFAKEMKEAGEASLTRISLAISILAVLVAMVTVLSHRSHTEAVLKQLNAMDGWGEYQTRKVRTESLKVTVDLLTLQPGSDPAATKKLTDDYKFKIGKWTGELSDDKEKAQELQVQVEEVEKKAAKYDLGEALLQIAVVLSSITLFTRKKAYYFLGLALGAAGVAVVALGLLTP